MRDPEPELAARIHKQFNENDIFICFSGPVSQNLIEAIVEMLQALFAPSPKERSHYHKVLSVFVEQIQNILRYSADEPSAGTIAVGKRNNHFFLLAGNRIHSKDADAIEQRISPLKDMDHKELRKYYKEERKKNPSDSPVNRGGLGLIQIARDASEPIDFHFEALDDETTFFSLKVVI